MGSLRFRYSSSFMKEWYKCGLTIENRQELQNSILDFLLQTPDNNYGKSFPGEIIQGTGGAIKYRFSPESSNKGKSGSYRTIYFVYDDVGKNAFFLNVYGKNKKASLTKNEKKAIKAFIKEIKSMKGRS